MKNKKLIVTAVAAALVVSMQAGTVFAAEVSDSDLETAVIQTQAADNAPTEEDDTDATDVQEDETDVTDVQEDEVDVTDTQEDETDVTDVQEDEVDVTDTQEDETDTTDAQEDADETAGVSEDEEAEDEPTIEEIQALIDEFIAEYKADPDADEEDVAQVQDILNGLLEEITQSERFLNSELTLADVREYFEETLDSFVFDDDDEEIVTAGQCGDHLTWQFDETTGTLTISGTGDMYDFSDEEYEDFWWDDVCFDVQKVVLKDGITSLTNGAFLGLDIETLDIPASVTFISNEAFAINEKLGSINVAAGNQYYASKDGVLFNKGMTELLLYPAAKPDESYTIPATVRKVGNSAFEYGSNLTEVVIPDSVTVIDDGAFSSCRRLAKVTMGNSVTTIGEAAFAQSVALDEIVLGNSVQHIGYLAFYGSGITKITLPHYLKSVEYSAFGDCALTDVYYLGTEEEWKALALDEPTAEEGAAYPVFHFTPAERYDEPTPWEASETETFTLDEETLAEIEETITEFIEEVKDDEDITDEQAEEIETFLTEWLDKVKKLGSNDPEMTEEALEDLSNFFEEFLQNVLDYFLDEFETSGRCGDDLTWEFDKETGLLTITGDGDMYDYYEDPDADENADDDIDEDIEDFEDLEDNTEPTVEDIIQLLTEDFFSIYTDTTDELTDDEDDGEIPWLVFSTLIKEVKFVGNITSISSGAFLYCDIATIDIPASVKSIGPDAFGYNTRLTSIHVAEDNENYSSIDGVFFDKAGEELLLYPLNKADKAYTVPDTVKEITEYAFTNSRYLTDVVIPACVTNIRDGVFYHCRQLASVKMEGAEIIGYGAFMNCYKLKEVIFGGALASIDSQAFSSTGLTQITLPRSLEFLSYDAFDDSNITDVQYLGTEDEWNKIDFDFDEDEDETETAVFANAVIHYLPTAPADEPSSGNGTTDDETKTDDTPKTDKTTTTSKTTKTAKPAGKSSSKSNSKNTGKKPSKGDSKKNPKTGEESAALPFVALIASAFSMAAAFAVSKFRRLKGKEV